MFDFPYPPWQRASPENPRGESPMTKKIETIPRMSKPVPIVPMQQMTKPVLDRTIPVRTNDSQRYVLAQVARALGLDGRAEVFRLAFDYWVQREPKIRTIVAQALEDFQNHGDGDV